MPPSFANSPGKIRTCNLVVTAIPKFPLGLDYLISLIIRESGAGEAYR